MYKSLIDGHECTPQHYLVELVAKREADKARESLAPKFWTLPEWKKKYKLQVIAALSLLKIFTMQEILDGLRCREGSWIYSLQFRGLIDIINNEKIKRNRATESCKVIKPNIPIETKEVNVDSKPVVRKKENILDRLEDIDADIQRHNF